MTSWSNHPQTRLVERLKPVQAPLRAHLREGPFTFSRHDAAFDELPVFREIEKACPLPKREGLTGSARLVFWNVERLRHLDAIAGHLQDHTPDVILLSEVDRGMARTGNTDRIAMLSERLGIGYLFAVEFVELDLGDVHEQRFHAGEENTDGLHGAATLSDVALHAPALIRIERRGNWYGLDRHEPRIGSTIALLAWVKLDDEMVLMANVHLESHETPASRGEDMQNLLTVIETLAPKGRVVIGGDFNTSTGSHGERHGDPAGWAARLAAEPMRLLRPEPYEPLFSAAAALGYEWQSCNLPDQPTTRYPAGSTRPPAKIDWVFTRNLKASDVALLPAVQCDGTPASDHEGLLLTIALA